MGTISFTCTQCSRQLSVPDRFQGRDLKCPSCGHPFKVELPRAAPETALPHPVAAAPEPPSANALPFGTSPFDEPPARSHGSAEPGTPQTQSLEAEPVFWQVKRIGVASLAAVSGLLHAATGLLVGLLVAAASFTPAAQAIPFLHGPLLGVLAIVLLPLAYGAVGFVLGAVMAVVYNLAARLVGGIRLLLE